MVFHQEGGQTLEQVTQGRRHGPKTARVQEAFRQCSQIYVLQYTGTGFIDPCGSHPTLDILWFYGSSCQPEPKKDWVASILHFLKMMMMIIIIKKTIIIIIQLVLKSAVAIAPFLSKRVTTNEAIFLISSSCFKQTSKQNKATNDPLDLMSVYILFYILLYNLFM